MRSKHPYPCQDCGKLIKNRYYFHGEFLCYECYQNKATWMPQGYKIKLPKIEKLKEKKWKLSEHQCERAFPISTEELLYLRDCHNLTVVKRKTKHL